jgi:hypothetical protein
MAHFAQNTTVPVERSQQEVQKILRRYGADRFGTMEDRKAAYLMFEYNSILIQITVPIPTKEEFSKTEKGRIRRNNQAEQAYDQAVKQRWRALVLGVKAKLEFVESGISTIEKEFMGWIMLPDGRPLSDHILPKIQEIAKTGKMPRLLAMSHEDKN